MEAEAAFAGDVFAGFPAGAATVALAGPAGGIVAGFAEPFAGTAALGSLEVEGGSVGGVGLDGFLATGSGLVNVGVTAPRGGTGGGGVAPGIGEGIAEG